MRSLVSLVPLPESFYQPSARIVSRRLLGHILVRNTPEGPCGGAIVETEAYLTDDPACHGAPGETPRNRVMWGHYGKSYVYLIYGYHFCFNAVCRPKGIAEAVLIRALDPLFGKEIMLQRRPVEDPRQLTSGPAKLCAALAITRELDGVDLCEASSDLFIARNPTIETYRKEHGPVVVTTRIGITKAAELPLRFYLQKNKFVSRKAPDVIRPRGNRG